MPEQQLPTVTVSPQGNTPPAFDAKAWMKKLIAENDEVASSPQAAFQRLAEQAKTDKAAAEFHQSIAGLPEGSRFNVLSQAYEVADEEAEQEFEEKYPGVLTAFRHKDLGKRVADGLFSGGMDQAAWGKAGLEGLAKDRVGKSLLSAVATAASRHPIVNTARLYSGASAAGLVPGPLDYIAGVPAEPDAPASGANAARGVGILNNALQAYLEKRSGGAGRLGSIASAMTGSKGQIGMRIGEGALGGLAASGVEGTDQGVGVLGGGAAGLLFGAVPGALASRLSKTGAVKLRTDADGALLEPTFGDKSPLKVKYVEGGGFTQNQLDKIAEREGADVVAATNAMQNAAKTLRDAYNYTGGPKDMADILAKDSVDPAVIQAKTQYKAAQKLIQERASRETYAEMLSKKTPKEVYNEANSFVEDLFPSAGKGRRDVTSQEATAQLEKLWNVFNSSQHWRKAVKQTIVNKFASLEKNTIPAAKMADRLASLPFETKSLVNQIFKDEKAFEKLVAVAEAHKKFADLESPLMALTTGRRSSSPEGGARRTYGAVFGDVAHVLTLENFAEAIMQKKGVIPSLLSQWGENIVAGRGTPANVTRAVERGIIEMLADAQNNPSVEKRALAKKRRAYLAGQERTIEDPRQGKTGLQEIAEKVKAASEAEKARGLVNTGNSRGGGR